MRDPRSEPKPGDVLIVRKGRQFQQRKVLKANGMVSVEITDHHDRGPRYQMPYLSQWQAWAKHAEVVKQNDL